MAACMQGFIVAMYMDGGLSGNAFTGLASSRCKGFRIEGCP